MMPRYHFLPRPVDPGERVVASARQDARRQADICRRRGIRPDQFSLGQIYGQMLASEFDLHADPVALLAAKNEIRFLLVDHLRRST